MKRAAGALLLSVSIDRSSPRQVTSQICIALREVILSGALKPGARLPASRTLARDLGVSRTT
ncbi:MAG: GntR family transcriptional regulator, partial [Arenicellales bacterium]